PEDYHLVVSELVPYKRVDAAVRVFAQRGQRLKIVGDGPEYKRLRAMASANIEFCGRVVDSDLRRLYAKCIALVMPGEEDFGITAVEALASGKPVVALGRGGACETVPEESPFGGILYDDASDAGLLSAVDEIESCYQDVQPHALQRWAKRFSKAEFMRRMSDFLALRRSSREERFQLRR
ncbi:MAG: glycosyltransferase, partial [Acidobacteriaceae bacterium]|nr:glycosyltransferase [Acidobacteriaceae bacterium]